MKSFQNKKVKIVATLGPASNNKKTLVAMLDAGLNIARMNFSHGSQEEHLGNLHIIKAASKLAKKPIAILQDLSGPKIRIGEVENNSITLVSGEKTVLTTKPCIGTAQRMYVNYKKLPQEISVGNTVKIEDGKKELRVTKVSGTEIYCDIVVGGMLSSKKGVNLPNVELSISSLTKKDKEDVLFGIKHKVDFIAFSFVQNKKDVMELRRILDKHHCKAKIISKIETTAAVKNIDEIIEVSDGIMVARGDMAVEVGAEKVPMIQKMIINKCNILGKPVITATQMLDSMEKNPVPTRAEVSDIANAILDGSDAIMLSGETAIGDYPVLSIDMMRKIAQRTESHITNSNLEYIGDSRDLIDTLSAGAVRTANNIRARLVVSLTQSGHQARMIARYKPHHGIIAITDNEQTFGQLQLSYGCFPILMKVSGDFKSITSKIQNLVKKNSWASAGEKIVITMNTGTKDKIYSLLVIEAK